MPVSAAYKIGMTDEWIDTKLLESQCWNHCKTAPPHLLLRRNSSVLLLLEQPSTVVYPRHHNQAKKLASTLLQNSSSPQQKELLLVLYGETELTCITRSRTRSRNTESSTKWTLDNFKTCIMMVKVAKKKLHAVQQCWTFLHGFTLILVISHDNFNCLSNCQRGVLWLVHYDFAVSALWLSAVHNAAYCTW